MASAWASVFSCQREKLTGPNISGILAPKLQSNTLEDPLGVGSRLLHPPAVGHRAREGHKGYQRVSDEVVHLRRREVEDLRNVSSGEGQHYAAPKGEVGMRDTPERRPWAVRLPGVLRGCALKWWGFEGRA